jgi:hypothetical protein
MPWLTKPPRCAGEHTVPTAESTVRMTYSLDFLNLSNQLLMMLIADVTMRGEYTMMQHSQQIQKKKGYKKCRNIRSSFNYRQTAFFLFDA